jgi:hypothetical protein
LASSVALERVQSDALKRADVIQRFGHVQDCQHLQRRFGIESDGIDPAEKKATSGETVTVAEIGDWYLASRPIGVKDISSVLYACSIGSAH